MCTQACSSTVISLSKNPKFLFVCFVFAFICLFCLAFFSHVLGTISSCSPFHMLVCYHMFSIGFVLEFLSFNTIHSHVHTWCHRCYVAERWVKVSHALVWTGIWYCLNVRSMFLIPIVCLVWFYDCHNTLLPWLSCCLAFGWVEK